ncbi:MAG: putative nucleotidyltransferase with HDIG domain [Alteromonadaceae bacterium]|jgi:putative nucleotidyltransferase with HDIG domain
MNILIIDASQPQLKTLQAGFEKSNSSLIYINELDFSMNTLTTAKFNVVIISAALKKISAVKLLASLTNSFPAMVRVVISDQSTLLKHVDGLAHYNYMQPINTKNIVQTITSLAENQKAITKESIIKAVALVKTLPSPPKVYMQLNAVLKENNADSKKISDIISQDPALAAKVLQFSNNAFMNKGKTLNSISDAITKMGLDALCCIVMTAELFSYEPDIKGFSLLDQQLHCLATAKLAASLVKPELKQAAMLAGLLHDIGKIVLFEMNPKLTSLYLKNYKLTANNTALENKVFKTNHCQIGAYLLHMWSFSYTLIEAIILHHSPEKLLGKSFGVAQAVYLADTLLHEREPCTKFIEHYKMQGILEKLQDRALRLK